MPKFTRGLVLAAMLAVLSSATAAVAQEPPNSWNETIAQYRAGERASIGEPVSDQAVQRFRAGERASMAQPASQDARHQALAQERYYTTWGYADPAATRALAQERYYSTWRPGGATGPVRPADSSRQPARLVVALGVLAAALALIGVLAATIARRASRKVAARQAA
jgi:hypothetical protein